MVLPFVISITTTLRAEKQAFPCETFQRMQFCIKKTSTDLEHLKEIVSAQFEIIFRHNTQNCAQQNADLLRNCIYSIQRRTENTFSSSIGLRVNKVILIITEVNTINKVLQIYYESSNFIRQLINSQAHQLSTDLCRARYF